MFIFWSKLHQILFDFLEKDYFFTIYFSKTVTIIHFHYAESDSMQSDSVSFNIYFISVTNILKELSYYPGTVIFFYFFEHLIFHVRDVKIA